jgi:AcrR family transcriptional regulator
VPRAGLDGGVLAAAGAALADEVGLAGLTMSALAERVGVRTPSLYKHVAGQDEILRRIAVLAFDEVGATVGAAVQGLEGRRALGAAARALRDFVVQHPGRYAATLAVPTDGPDDAVAAASLRALAPLEAVLRGYDLEAGQSTHALRALRSMFHGFAALQADGGFRWSTDVDASLEWLVDLVDRGLRTAGDDEPERIGGNRIAAEPTG